MDRNNLGYFATIKKYTKIKYKVETKIQILSNDIDGKLDKFWWQAMSSQSPTYQVPVCFFFRVDPRALYAITSIAFNLLFYATASLFLCAVIQQRQLTNQPATTGAKPNVNRSLTQKALHSTVPDSELLLICYVLNYWLGLSMEKSTKRKIEILKGIRKELFFF